MIRLGAGAVGAACILAISGVQLRAQWRGSLGLEGQAFPSALSESPELGLLFTFRGAVDLGQGPSRFAIEPFLLLDLTGSRTLFDLAELTWTATWDDWEVGVGSRVTFWGVAESAHLVDVINQRMPRFTTEGYRRLGQPMAWGAWLTDWGTFTAFVLPGPRERPFYGPAGSIWSELRVDDARSGAGKRGGRHAVDWAVRWSHSAAEWDVALSHFSGRSRDPHFEETQKAASSPVLNPVYPLIDQTSVELQWTRAAWMFKLEGLTRSDGADRYEAFAGGLEYVVADYLSFFTEYAYDGRGSTATTSLEHDAFAGGRLLTQQGDFEAGVFIDTRSGNLIARAAARRRLTNRLTLALQARAFRGDATREPTHALSQQSFVSITFLAAF